VRADSCPASTTYRLKVKFPDSPNQNTIADLSQLHVDNKPNSKVFLVSPTMCKFETTTTKVTQSWNGDASSWQNQNVDGTSPL